MQNEKPHGGPESPTQEDPSKTQSKHQAGGCNSVHVREASNRPKMPEIPSIQGIQGPSLWQ